jgi:hypothetical protein
MFWKKFSLWDTKETKEISVFLLKAEISFKTVAQVSYNDEYGNNKIVRFFDQCWIREVLSFTGNPDDIGLKFSTHSPNLNKDEFVRLSIVSKGQVLLNHVYSLNSNKDFTDWYELES